MEKNQIWIHWLLGMFYYFMVVRGARTANMLSHKAQHLTEAMSQIFPVHVKCAQNSIILLTQVTSLINIYWYLHFPGRTLQRWQIGSSASLFGRMRKHAPVYWYLTCTSVFLHYARLRKPTSLIITSGRDQIFSFCQECTRITLEAVPRFSTWHC